MKYQILFSLKDNEKVFMNVVCCSRDWRVKGTHICSPIYQKRIKLPLKFSAEDGAFDEKHQHFVV